MWRTRIDIRIGTEFAIHASEKLIGMVGPEHKKFRAFRLFAIRVSEFIFYSKIRSNISIGGIGKCRVKYDDVLIQQDHTFRVFTQTIMIQRGLYDGVVIVHALNPVVVFCLHTIDSQKSVHATKADKRTRGSDWNIFIKPRYPGLSRPGIVVSPTCPENRAVYRLYSKDLTVVKSIGAYNGLN